MFTVKPHEKQTSPEFPSLADIISIVCDSQKEGRKKTERKKEWRFGKSVSLTNIFYM